jgi:crotonobetainyl-CoA:carnitine CoA-transferase CaiB-like acyl-CoA transferase
VSELDCDPANLGKLYGLFYNCRYETNAARVRNRAELIPLISSIISQVDRETWIQRLSLVGVTVAPINSVKEALQDPQVLHRDMVVRVQHPSAPEPIKLIGLPVKYSDPSASASVRLAPPTLGQHTREVLSQVLHMPDADINALLSAKVAV